MSTARPEQIQNDPEHPIPNLDVCDIHGERKDGGHDLVIVIASPMDGSPRSQSRLIQKIEGYLALLSVLRNQNPGSQSPHTADSNRIVVKIHPECDPVVFDLLERSKPWVADNDALLEINKIA